jgi:hypothetical protein
MIERPATYFWQEAAMSAMSAIAHRVDHDRGGQPYLRIQVRKQCAVDLRLPPIAATTVLQLTLNGRPIRDPVSSGHCRLSGLQPGDALVVTYPLVERREAHTVAGRGYMTSWRGQTVVNIEPAAERCPSYRRRTMEESQPPNAPRLFAPSARQLPW